MSGTRQQGEPARSAVADEVARLGPWFHNLTLPCGVETAPDHPLGDFPAVMWRQFCKHLPDDLSGWTVLDIGCNAGFYSFALGQRGASVLGIDVDPRYVRQARWAATWFAHLDVRFEQMQVYDLVELDRSFDLVLFMGVLYHLRHPLLALDALRERVGRLLVFQTMQLPDAAALEPPDDLPLASRDLLAAQGWPSMAFVEHRLADDPTNWWVPDPACVRAMLRSSGFELLDRPAEELWLCAPAPLRDQGQAARVRAELQAASGIARRRRRSP